MPRYKRLGKYKPLPFAADDRDEVTITVRLKHCGLPVKGNLTRTIRVEAAKVSEVSKLIEKMLFYEK